MLGLIATVSSSRGGGNNDIKLVESLVTSYIKKPSCIILLTITCESELTYSFFTIVLSCCPNSRLRESRCKSSYKTIWPGGKAHSWYILPLFFSIHCSFTHSQLFLGVLTKPDRIPSGEAESWLSFIRNEKELLTNGWYAVKQPGSKAIENGITWEEAREEENRFFAAESGWCDLDPIYHKYLRTSNLVARLCEILSDLIAKRFVSWLSYIIYRLYSLFNLRRLPEIHTELDKTISETRGRLNKLPKAPSSDPVNDICTLIHTFTTDLARHVEGVPDQDGLLQAIRPAQNKFRQAIRATAPNFQPFEEKLKATRPLISPSFLSHEEGADDARDSKEDEGDENKPIYIDAVMERADQ